MSRSAYELISGNDVEEIGFIYGKDRRIGASPDGLIKNRTQGLELKNPYTSKVHAEFLAMDKMKSEYILQCQFSMYVTGLSQWDFASFDPRFKKNMLKFITIEKDEKTFERFDNELPVFIYEMDLILNKLELQWGDQWK